MAVYPPIPTSSAAIQLNTMRIPASNAPVASRRYSYRQRSDEIFVPTGMSSASAVLKEKGTSKSVPDGTDGDAIDRQDVMPIVDTTNLPSVRESGANRSVNRFGVELKMQQQQKEVDKSVAASAAVDNTTNLAEPEVHEDNQVENQENQFIAANQKEGNRAYRTSSGINPVKLGDAPSSITQQHKPGSLAERRLQQRSAIFKKGDLENQPSLVNTVLAKKRLGGASDAASTMLLTENHRVGPDKPIALSEGPTWNSRRNNDSAPRASQSAIQQKEEPKAENSTSVATEEKNETTTPTSSKGTNGGVTDFATKLAWAAKLEKRRDVFAKKTTTTPTNHHRHQAKKHTDVITSKPEKSENADTVTNNVNDATHDDRSETKAVSGQLVESPSNLSFSNTKAWAAELAKQKVLSDKKKRLEIIDDGEETTNANVTTTTTDKDEKNEFSARLRAKRRQLSDKKRKTNESIVASEDKAEDSVWYDFEIPTSEKQQSVSLSYSGTMDEDQSVHCPDSVATEGAEKALPPGPNPLTPMLLQQEKRILSLEKKRQTYNGLPCEEQAQKDTTPMTKPLAESTTVNDYQGGFDDVVETTMTNENKHANHATSLFDNTSPFEMINDHNDTEHLSQVHEAFQKDNQWDATSVLSEAQCERSTKDFPMPSKSDLHLNLTSKQQIAFSKIMAEYETKLECKSSEIEYLKNEISHQHVQILELLGQTKTARETTADLTEERTETKGKKSKMRFSLKGLSKMKFSR